MEGKSPHFLAKIDVEIHTGFNEKISEGMGTYYVKFIMIFFRQLMHINFIFST